MPQEFDLLFIFSKIKPRMKNFYATLSTYFCIRNPGAMLLVAPCIERGP